MKTVYFDKDIPRILLTKAAAKVCKPLLYTGINAVKYKTLPDPALPAGDWVRVRNVACGLCGTDVSFFKATTGTNSALEPIPGSKRTFLGHENVGVVTEVGKDVTDFKVGDRVTIRACDTKGIHERCHYCEEGDYNFCLNYGAPSPYGEVTTGAGWSDSFIYPARGLAHIYDELTDEQAVMVEPTCVSIHSVLCAPPQKGEKVLVMGCGAIGLGVVQAIKIVQPDCEVWVLERVPSRQEFAKKLGADHVLSGEIYEATSKATGGSPVYTGMGGNRYFFGGFDRVYDCVGGDWSNHTAVRLLRARELPAMRVQKRVHLFLRRLREHCQYVLPVHALSFPFVCVQSAQRSAYASRGRVARSASSSVPPSTQRRSSALESAPRLSSSAS